MRISLRRRERRGLTLAEMLVAGAVLALIASGLAAVASTMYEANARCQGQTKALQHARVALRRIEENVRDAYANEQFPGCLVISTQAGGYDFPDALAIWAPAGSPASPAGLPRVSELVVYCPHPDEPNELLEIRHPTDASAVPAVSDAAAWQALVEDLQTDAAAEAVTVTNLLRRGNVTNSTLLAAPQRGAARFRVTLAPSAGEWQEYRAGTRAWSNLAWPLGVHGAQMGLRRVVCAVELQLTAADSDDVEEVLPFFGSAALQYGLAP